MYYQTHTELSVNDVANLLSCRDTYVYKCVRDNRIKPVKTDPYRIRFDEVIAYVDSTIPPNFKTYYKSV